MADEEAEIAQAQKDAQRASLLEWFWWIFTPVVVITYLVISNEPMAERIMLSAISAMSSMALAITYGAKKEAALSKKAGYEHP